jgi:DEAD/DEAH box helicase domain-containing protein
MHHSGQSHLKMLITLRYHPNPKYLPQPSRHVSIRGGQDETYCAIDVTKIDQPGGHARILEEIEIRRALFELYEGGIVSIA